MAEDESSSSGSSDDAVLITSKHRKKLRQRTAEAAGPATPSSATGGATKPDHICGVCERDGGALVVCAGSCVSAFHVACLGGDAAVATTSTGPWKCPSCAAGTHVCFHCKQRGVAASDGDDAGLRAVVKCRALSCGKYYHQDCIATLALARIAGSRFICPLHTCAACEQSGAKKEPVRCTRCPVAYHTSCLPSTGVVPLPGKRIICPKHDGSQPPTLEIATTATGEPRDKDAVEEGEVEEGEEGEEEEEEEEGEEKEPAGVVKPAPALSRVADDHDAAHSVAASSPRTEENDEDARSDASGGGSGKKHSKSSKKDKKKKKKKKKKDKKKEKDRTKSSGDGDAASDKEDGAKKSDKSKKSSKSSSSSSKEERPVGDNDLARGDEGERDDTMTGTVSTDNGEEEKAEPPVPVKRERDSVASPAPLEPSESHRGEDRVASPSVEVEAPVPSTTPAAIVTTEGPAEHVKVEQKQEEKLESDQHEREQHAVAETKPSSTPVAPATSPLVVEADTTAAVDEDRTDQSVGESEPAQSHSAPEAPNLPTKLEQTDSRNDDTNGETRENLTVKIPEVLAGSIGEDGEGDDDSGSGSGSQSAKSRRSSRVDDVVKERSGGSSRSKKSKKKRKGANDAMKRGPGDEEEGREDEPKDEAKWVQCDDCKKWRTVAKEIDLDAMPETWYCKMNTWNKAFASCEIPEEVVETKKSKPSKRGAAAIGEVTTPVPKKAKLTKQSSAPELPPADDAESGSVEKEKAVAAPVKKKADKDSKKRKLKLKLREKYGEVNWVQCENKQCGKWRVVPSSANALPSVWYCNLNTWAPELASCSAANPPDVEAYLSKSTSKKPSGTRPPKRQRGPDHQESAGSSTAGNQSEVVTRPAGIKPSKGSAKGSTPTAHVGGTAASSAGTSSGAASASSQNVAGPGAAKAALAGVKSVVLEWAQCEKCLKWRKLPAHIKSSTLPDKWYCSMNHWDPSRASCALPQEEDQEPIDASPLPSSQNWYPMPGQVGGTSSTGGSSLRSKRGKLSYSELLYASTGQLRKTYTSDSSTLSFEYEGVTYYRDDQYKRSSMYVSPLTTNKISGEQIDPQSEALKVKDFALQLVAPAMQQLVDQVSKVILSKIDLRRDFAVTEIVDSVLCDSEVGSGDLSLSVITSAIAQLVTAGELEKVDRSSSHSAHSREERDPRLGATPTSVLLGSLSSQTAYYRKVPKRPLKALKAWKLAGSL